MTGKNVYGNRVLTIRVLCCLKICASSLRSFALNRFYLNHTILSSLVLNVVAFFSNPSTVFPFLLFSPLLIFILTLFRCKKAERGLLSIGTIQIVTFISSSSTFFIAKTGASSGITHAVRKGSVNGKTIANTVVSGAQQFQESALRASVCTPQAPKSTNAADLGFTPFFQGADWKRVCLHTRHTFLSSLGYFLFMHIKRDLSAETS